MRGGDKKTRNTKRRLPGENSSARSSGENEENDDDLSWDSNLSSGSLTTTKKRKMEKTGGENELDDSWMKEFEAGDNLDYNFDFEGEEKESSVDTETRLQRAIEAGQKDDFWEMQDSE